MALNKTKKLFLVVLLWANKSTVGTMDEEESAHVAEDEFGSDSGMQPSEFELEGTDFNFDDGNLDTVFDEVSARICELNSKIEDMKNSFKSTLLQLGHAINEDKCDIKFEEKCFHVIAAQSSRANYSGAEHLCRNMGWKLANVYGIGHQEIVEGYVRTKIPQGSNNLTLWTGINLDAEGTVVIPSLEESLDISDLKFQSADNTAANSRFAIQVSEDPFGEDQGIGAYNEGEELDGALCEL